jgi:2,4-dienoyl-CoA reductase-like NADH-dependent reductase (Old Yellow Enzyme family)
MTTDAFAHLLAPGRIGPMATRNRIVMAPMGDRLAHDDGKVSARQAAYLEARARGGAGLILVGSVSVSYPSGSYAPSQTAISADHFVPGLSELVRRVHHHGAAIAAQLVHDGANSLFDIAQGRPLLVPSVPPRLRPDRLSAMITGEELTAMTAPFTAPGASVGYRVADEDDLAALVEAFAAAARRAVAAGFDGVEVHAGHGYLIDSFLSPATNGRDDAWGGSVAGRARLLCEVLAAVRQEVGDSAAVWCRLNAVERFREGGETPEDLPEVARRAVAAGAQALSVSAATDAGAALGVTEAHTPHEPGLLLGYAAAVAAKVDVPVITVGRIEPEVAERVLADGGADFVAMGRKLLADPDLPNKLAAGRRDDIRPCIYQYRCIGNIFLGRPVACVANAATAHGDEADLPPARHPRRVLVVGGGPAGLEVARLAARRGHQVVLADREPHLGGALRVAAHTDEVLDQFLGWLLRQVDQEGVDLALATAVTPALVSSLGVSDVVVATGGRWVRPPMDGDGVDRVRTLADVAGWFEPSPPADGSGSHPPEGPVVVLGGGKAGLSMAGFWARRGHAVTVLESSDVFAPQLGPPGRFRLVHDTEQLGVRLEPGATVVAVGPTSVSWRGADGQDHRVEATSVVSSWLDVGGPAGGDTLADELRGATPAAGGPDGPTVHLVGDARANGGIEGAMSDARAVATLLA